MAAVYAVVCFSQINILIEGAIVSAGASSQVIHGGSLICVERCGQSDQDRVACVVSLAVVIKEEEGMVLHNRSADVSAKLVEVITRLQRGRPASSEGRSQLEIVDGIVGIQAAVAEEFECVAMERIGS